MPSSPSKKSLKRRKKGSIIDKDHFQFPSLPYELQRQIVDKLGCIDRLLFKRTNRSAQNLICHSGLLPRNFIGFELNPIDKDAACVTTHLRSRENEVQRLLYNFHSRTPRKRDYKCDSIEIFVSPNGNNEIRLFDAYRTISYRFNDPSISKRFVDKILERTRIKRLSFTDFVRCSTLMKIEHNYGFDKNQMSDVKIHFPSQEVKIECFTETFEDFTKKLLDIENEHLTLNKKGFFTPRASFGFSYDLTKEMIGRKLFKTAHRLYITGDLFEANAIPLLLNRPIVDLNISVRPFISTIQSLLVQALPQNVKEAVFTSTYTENHFMIKGILDLMAEAQKRLTPLSKDQLSQYFNSEQQAEYERKYLIFKQTHEDKEFLWMVMNVGHGAKYHVRRASMAEENNSDIND